MNMSRQNMYQNSRNYSSCQTLPAVLKKCQSNQVNEYNDYSSSPNSGATKSAEEEFLSMIEPSLFSHQFKKPMKKLSSAKKEG